ncbi:MAG: glycosyltransferase family 4 protein, partial [Gammaproteobacteria bacterium]
MTLFSLLLVLLAFLSGWAGTAAVRRYSLARNILDIPNHRSSHAVPTPRGGGLSISIVVLLSILLLAWTGPLRDIFLVALLPACFVVALIGWVDDHRPLSAAVRGLGYLMAALWFVFWTGVSGVVVGAVLVLGIAWLTNLYNFMDGTDGLAGSQAVLAGIAGGGLLWIQGHPDIALLAFVMAAASAGFLVLNWPPAKIFMGDVGSCLLGFLFACLAILGELLAGLPALLWLVLLGFFVWDATLTLLMRIFRRERWYSAHKCHAYQRLIQLGLSHGQLLALFIMFNLLVLWPLAWWGYQQPGLLLVAVFLSVVATGLIWLIVQVYYYRMTAG